MSDKPENQVDGDDIIDEAEEEALLKSDDDDPMGSEADDDESDDDEENRLIKDYLEILGLIDQNKYGYENYVLLIETAHKLSDLEKIRQSYELFSAVYPVSPELWLKLLKIENSLASSESEFEECEKLFRRALDDYYCPNVAIEFAKFAPKVQNAEKVWSEILSVYSLHCTKGLEIFTLWNSYFNAKEDSVEKPKLLQQTYEKILKIPMRDMEEIYIEFKVFAEKNKAEITVDWERVDKRYNRAKTHLQKMLPFETKLAAVDAKFHQNRASVYKDYIAEADRFADENILQVLYERMVTECCLNPSCWLDYVGYLEKRDKYGRPDELENFPTFEQTAMDVVNRALRNCTWSELLFIKKMRLAEKLEMAKSEIQAIFEQGLEAGFQTSEPIVALWLEYLAYLTRNTNFDDENEVEVLRANFNFSWTSLGKQWGVLADCSCEILQFWGKLEYGPLKDPAKGKELWTTVMESSDNSLKSGLWMEFIHLELTKGVDAARKIYRKALNAQSIDNPYIIASSWLRFERCNGTIDQIASCQEQATTILTLFEQQQKYTDRQNRSKFDEKPKGKPPTAVGNASGKRKATISQSNNSDLAASPTKKKKPDGVDGVFHKKSEATASQSETSEIDTTKDPLRVFLSNLDYNVTEDEVKEAFPELEITHIHLIKAPNGKSRGFGYAELSSEAQVKKAIEFDRRKLGERPVYISTVLRDKEQRQKFKYSDKVEPTKLFVKGIPYESTVEDLQALFSPYGAVKDIRIVYHKSGKPKGIAFIEYVDDTSASTAVMKLDQTEIKGFTLNVAISAPPPKPSVKDASSIKKILGGVKKAIIRGEQKPRMSFIPTSVRKNVLKTPVAIPTNGNTEPPKPKSNDDFRKLLNK